MHCKFFNTQFMSETEYNYQYLMRLKSIIKKFSVKTWKEKKKRYYSGFSKSLLTSGSFSFGVNRSWKDSWFLHFSHYKVYSLSYSLLSINYITTAHLGCDGHSISIITYGVWLCEGHEPRFKSLGGSFTHIYI